MMLLLILGDAGELYDAVCSDPQSLGEGLNRLGQSG